MSSRNGAAVWHHPPPRVMPSGRFIANTTATTSSSIQVSKMAARDRAQSWRGKYLRALNICPEDVELARRKADATTPTGEGKARLRTLSYSRGDFPERNSISRSYSSSTEKEDEERKSLERLAQQDNVHDDLNKHQRIQAVPLRVPSRTIPVNPPTANASNPYGFAIRPELARGRRCHTDPFALRERMSAPIQIPSIRSGVSTQLDGNDRTVDSKTLTGAQRTPFANVNQTVGLMSWEDPVAMSDAVATGWHVPTHVTSEHAPAFGDNLFDEHHHMHDDEEDVEDDDDHGGDIFEMEGLHDSSDNDENQSSNDHAPVSAKSRRRIRTASLNIVSSGREKRVHRPAFDTEEAPMGHMMSQSFVPPHQLVRRDCFSIGMRDEFKRRPANNI